jgi:hypothetical protein
LPPPDRDLVLQMITAFEGDGPVPSFPG